MTTLPDDIQTIKIGYNTCITTIKTIDKMIKSYKNQSIELQQHIIFETNQAEKIVDKMKIDIAVLDIFEKLDTHSFNAQQINVFKNILSQVVSDGNEVANLLETIHQKIEKYIDNLKAKIICTHNLHESFNISFNHDVLHIYPIHRNI